MSGEREQDALGPEAARGKRFALVVSRYHSRVTAGLRDGALAFLEEKGARDVDVVEVPGSFEVPQMARQLIECGRYHGVVCLGALVRGETPHFDVLARAVAQGVQDVGLETGIPVTFGVLTTETLEQAAARSGPGEENKGREAARAALEMALLFDRHRTPRL
jgi:6,7-dimethyl-8-ribityllumazine synthase